MPHKKQAARRIFQTPPAWKPRIKNSLRFPTSPRTIRHDKFDKLLSSKWTEVPGHATTKTKETLNSQTSARRRRKLSEKMAAPFKRIPRMEDIHAEIEAGGWWIRFRRSAIFYWTGRYLNKSIRRNSRVTLHRQWGCLETASIYASAGRVDRVVLQTRGDRSSRTRAENSISSGEKHRW